MITRAVRQDLKALLSLYKSLWADADEGELTKAVLHNLERNESAVFLASEKGQAVGFAECSLRHDYVEGTDTSPVGYLEGIFVQPEYRKKGLAKELVKACEQWAKEKGCSEFASDCELNNNESKIFHKALGFDEVNAIICFAKKI